MKSINLNVGKLYSCEDYYLMLYPDKVAAEEAAASCTAWRAGSGCTPCAPWWTIRLGKPVSEVDKNVPLLVLNREGEYIEVLAGDRPGWIINEAWLNIKEIG